MQGDPPIPKEPPSVPLLAARGIVKSYGGVHAVSDVTLEFPAGSVTAIVGAPIVTGYNPLTQFFARQELEAEREGVGRLSVAGQVSI